jgi:hypothetical protein
MLSLRTLPEATDAPVVNSIAEQRQKLEAQLKAQLTLQEEAQRASLTNSPSPMIQGISSALVAALPYLAGRSSGGVQGGTIGAELGLKAAGQYGQQLQTEQKRKADIADLYLKSSDKLQGQLSSLAQAEEGLNVRREGQALNADLRRDQMQMMGQFRQESLAQRAQAQATNAIMAQTMQEDRIQRRKIERERLDLAIKNAQTEEQRAKAEEQKREEDLTPETAFVPGRVSKVVTRAAIKEKIDKEISTYAGIMTAADNLEKTIAEKGIQSQEAEAQVAGLIGAIKGPDALNFGAALTDGERAIIEGLMGTPSRGQFKARFFAKAFGDNPEAAMSGLRKVLASQKIVEGLAGGYKPHLLVVGHYHKAELLPRIRNVAALQAGTFQMQTPFMARKGAEAHVGGWIVEFELGELCNRVKTEFVSFF